MSGPIYMQMFDDGGELIKAGVKIKGREGFAEVYAMDYHVSVPSDPNSGLLTSVRKHANVEVIKRIDQSSPILFQACCRGQRLKSVCLNWYHISEQGVEENYFSHMLTDVKVVKVGSHLPCIKDQSNHMLGHQERIHFQFRSMKLHYADGNIEATDDWLTPHVS